MPGYYNPRPQQGDSAGIPAPAQRRIADHVTGLDFALDLMRSGEDSVENTPGVSVFVLNSTYTLFQQFDVVQIDTPIVAPGDSFDPWMFMAGFNCKAPTAPTGAESYIIVTEAIEPGKVGQGLISGIAPAEIVVNQSTDQYAKVVSGDTGQVYSTATPTSMRILYKQTGTDWGLILFPVPANPVFYCKITQVETFSATLQGNPCLPDGTSPDTATTITLDTDADVLGTNPIIIVSNLAIDAVVKCLRDPDDPLHGTVLGNAYLPRSEIPLTSADQYAPLWLKDDGTLTQGPLRAF